MKKNHKLLLTQKSEQEIVCRGCEEVNPGDFECCWNCEAYLTDEAQPG